MEEHFLERQVEGKATFAPVPWYNVHGDCIVFQMADEAVVADRIDELLTIYRSAIDNRPIGFQLKGILAIVRLLGLDGFECGSEFDEQGLLSVSVPGVSVPAILLAAYEQKPPTVRRRQNYAQAMNTGKGSIPRREIEAGLAMAN